MKKIFFIFILFSVFISNSQVTNENSIYKKVDVHAMPPTGINSFRQFIGSNFKLPAVSKEITAKVVTKFTVCQDGTICDIETIQEYPWFRISR